jgi:hypothetical protein
MEVKLKARSVPYDAVTIGGLVAMLFLVPIQDAGGDAYPARLDTVPVEISRLAILNYQICTLFSHFEALAEHNAPMVSVPV